MKTRVLDLRETEELMDFCRRHEYEARALQEAEERQRTPKRTQYPEEHWDINERDMR